MLISVFYCRILRDWRLKMNNKRGGFGTKFLLILILMLVSAAGGAYGYRVLDGKLAVNDAADTIDSIRISEYDSEEAVQIETYKEEAEKNLGTATTRKEVYEILEEFNENVSKVKTRTEKELEEARKAVNDANNKNNNNNNSTNDTGNTNDIFNNNNNNGNNTTDNSNNSNNGTNGNSQTDDKDDDSSGGLIGNLFGNDDDSNSNQTDTKDDSDPFNN